jgi:hypothetical protein
VNSRVAENPHGRGKPFGVPVAVRRAPVSTQERLASASPTLPACDASAWFAQYVGRKLRGPVLRYSQRQALVLEAQQRGIGRFEANLIIAAVLHRTGSGHQMDAVQIKPARCGWAAPVLTFVVVQGLILAAACWVLG